ncbi:MAG TPA: ABC transporter permease [Vicinamibacterales bacterium]|nr:ABC transporter permease [Vicinamibacterales bacterium]
MSRPDRFSHPLIQLTLVRAREFFREPEAVFWAVAFPVMLSVGLGLAFRGRPEAVLKIGAGPAIADTLRQEPGLDVTTMDEAAGREALRMGRVALMVDRAGDGSIAFRYDDTNPEGRSARTLADRALQRAAGRVDPVQTADELTREPGARYIDFLIPGLVGIGIMSNAVWGLGFSIVDTRRRKLIKRLMATPMSRPHYLGSYLIWRLMLFPVEVVLPIAFGAIAFGVPIRGSWITITILCLLGSLMFSAIGILVGSRARTIEGVSGLMNLVIMPMWIVSGVFFSAQRFPDLVQPIIKVLPLTLLLDSLRAVQLQGVGIASVWFELAVMTFWLVTAFTAGLKMFRWK